MLPGRLLALSAILVWVASCDAAPAGAPFAYPAFAVDRVTPPSWVAGTRFELTGDGIVPAPLATYTLDIEVGGQTATLPLEVVEGSLRGVAAGDWLPVDGFDPLPAPTAAIVHRSIDGSVQSSSIAGRISLLQMLPPRLDFIRSGAPIYPGDAVPIGAFDLYRAEEELADHSHSDYLVVRGHRSDESGASPTELTWSLRLLGGGLGGRAVDSVRMSPDLLGLRPGAFSGFAWIESFEPWQFEGFPTERLDYEVAIARPYLDGLASATTARGRWLGATGRGLLPLDAAAETASVLVFDGVFTPLRGAPEDHTGPDAWALPVEAVEGNTVGWVALRSQPDLDGGLAGLGARAGRFEGTVTLRVAARFGLLQVDEVRSDPLPIALDVTPPRQEVELRVLPGFDEALALFGLEAEREAVLARILAVLERDYAGVNIGFAYAAPAGVAEYGVVELAGPDPNGTHLFGLDNTSGKDAGNLRLDDVIGGFDAATRARGFAAYGGIFASELLNLSPSLSTNALASPRFDDVFAAVVPALGGIPAAAGESDRADARGGRIREAVRVLGNLVGSTITHEVGHTLGLTALAGRAHNDGDNPGWIMDAGVYRPFEERAELDGAGPAVFSPFNQTYLGEILPLAPTPQE
ncbi:MAG: hypothetical protein CVU56_12770 [Deltaproteobacteria bacterium HGW-Deltaproteobacteria-14]|nr:MAG: hypothetical protein CVU56_12770 [Deltaproteobacteria bacterium HGW-Deltaproteobacteria-14]